MLRSLLRPTLALLSALGLLAACVTPSGDAGGGGGGGGMASRCQPARVAELPLREARGFLVVPATLNGQATTLLIDTGAETTTLTPRAATALRLPADRAHDRLLAGITGNVRSTGVLLRQMALGGTVVATDRGASVGALPSLDRLDPPVAGLLGADILSGYDVELDLPAHRMALYAPNTCRGWRPWPKAITARIQRSITGLVLLDVRVDGQAVRALFDTGARTSLLTRERALTLGVTTQMLQGDEARTGRGVGGGSAVFRQHRFATLAVGGSADRDVPINVADLRLPGVEMLLGADFLGRRQVWISYSTGRLFMR
jgi:predicted aspartyl protease